MSREIKLGKYRKSGFKEKYLQNNSNEENILNQMPYKLTLFKDPKDERDFSFKSIKKFSSSSNLPSMVDYTNEMTAVKDQGNTGACVAFAVNAMKEWQETKEHSLEIKQGKKYNRKEEYDYSEAWTYRMCKLIDQWPNQEGTSIRAGMKVLNKLGVPKEQAWEYKNIWAEEPKHWAHLVARWARIGRYYRIYDLQDLKEALVQGPCVIGIPVFYEFFYPGKDGVIKDPAPGSYVYGGHAVCLSGDTEIPLLNGETKTIKQLSTEYKNKKFEVYSCTENGEIVAGIAHSPRLTDSNRKLLKITLDNNQYFKCTEEHLIMKRDGSYLEAKKLKINDSLMPLYRDNDYYNYERVWDNNYKKWIRTHRMVCKAPSDKVVHHKNFNKKDNSSKNLEIMTWDEHKELHSKNTILLKKYSKSKKGRLKSKENMEKNWQNEEFRKKMNKINKEKLHNHKIISIEECGIEDVYDLTVDTYHNLAINAGIFVHNCSCGFNNSTKLIKFKNSWNTNWGQNGYGYLSYDYINNYLWDAWACDDLQMTTDMLKEAKSLFS